MDLQTIGQLMLIMQSSELSALEVECDGMRVRMEKPVSMQSSVRNGKVKEAGSIGIIGDATPEETAVLLSKVSQMAAQAEAAPQPAEASQTRAGSKELKSPMVGTFHFIKGKEDLVGKKFAKGEPVCTIEAMKLMNEIVMEEDGEIAWVALSEGDMVEYGQLILTFE